MGRRGERFVVLRREKDRNPTSEIRQVQVHEGLVLNGVASLNRKTGRLPGAFVAYFAFHAGLRIEHERLG